jgi:hypothetical protein
MNWPQIDSAPLGLLRVSAQDETRDQKAEHLLYLK